MSHETCVIMQTEVKADCYHGPDCNQVKNVFETYCEGDMDSDTHSEDIILKVSELPAGTIIKVEYPSCPECLQVRADLIEWNNGSGRVVGHASKCDCGFDWDDWVLNTYS